MRKLILLITITGLVACSYIPRTAHIQNRDTHYLTAASIPPMRLPPGTSEHNIHNYYPVSDRSYANHTKKIDLTPPGL